LILLANSASCEQFKNTKRTGARLSALLHDFEPDSFSLCSIRQQYHCWVWACFQAPGCNEGSGSAGPLTRSGTSCARRLPASSMSRRRGDGRSMSSVSPPRAICSPPILFHRRRIHPYAARSGAPGLSARAIFPPACRVRPWCRSGWRSGGPGDPLGS
jgi:hypothetical protein